MPRRAGERGALEAGALPGLLPGGRPVADDAARAQVAAAWHVDELPSAPGRDVDGILAAAADGTLGALLVGGVEPDDFADPDAVLAALDAAGFVVSLELRHSAVTERADVVFPVAPTTQKAGTSSTGRAATAAFEPALHGSTQQPASRTTGCSTRWPTKWASYLGTAHRRAGPRGTVRAGQPGTANAPPARDVARRRTSRSPAAGEAVLAGWRMLLDDGPAAGRRAASGRHRAHARGAAVGRHRRRDRRR